MQLYKSVWIFFITIFLIGCTETNTQNPAKAYRYWAGERPSKDVEVIHGKYWQSAHWSKEYILYLEIKASSLWREAFIRQNDLIESKAVVGFPPDAPAWFKLESGYRILIPKGFNQGSVCYENPKTGYMFIYEIQL